MHSADKLMGEGSVESPVPSSRSPISVALLAAVACVPLVVAVGFLTGRSSVMISAEATVPGDISVMALRGGLDAPAAYRSYPPVRAGY